MVLTKFPLIIESSDRITLCANISCFKRGILLPIKFIVDTGSPYTFIGKDDAARQTRLLQNLNIKDQALMGGAKINIMKIPGPLKITLKQEDGQPCSIELPDFGFSDKTATKGYNVSPSIIGLDFLKVHGFKLFVDMKNNQAYLERSEPIEQGS